MWYLRPRLIVHTVCRDLSGVLLCKHAACVTVIMDVVEGVSVPMFTKYLCSKYFSVTSLGIYSMRGSVSKCQLQHRCGEILLLRMGFRRTDE